MHNAQCTMHNEVHQMKKFAGVLLFSLALIFLLALVAVPATAAPWCSQYCSCSSNCWTQCYDEGGANACFSYTCADFCGGFAPSKEKNVFAFALEAQAPLSSTQSTIEKAISRQAGEHNVRERVAMTGSDEVGVQTLPLFRVPVAWYPSPPVFINNLACSVPAR